MLADVMVEGYVIVHPRPAGAVVEFRERFNETVPPALAELDARLRDCPYAARQLDSSRRAKTDSIFRCLILKKDVM
jgi:hypothetical protein